MAIPTLAEFRERGPVWEAGWIAGCHAEADAYNEDMSKAAKSVRATLEGFARHPHWQDADEAEFSGLLFHIFTAGLPWWRRLRLARGRT